jgi:DNA-binding MarR family transcriptional regulator
MPRVFSKLRALRKYQERHLDFLRSIDDFDLIREIGFHQELGRPLTMKALCHLGVASAPATRRRVRHLRLAGAVQQVRSWRDGRAHVLRVTPKARRLLAKYAAAPRRRSAGQGRWNR